MKKLIIFIMCALMQNILISKDFFENSTTSQARNKIKSYQKFDGTVISIDNINNGNKTIEMKNVKTEKLQSFQKAKINRKFIFHRLNNTTYESTDLKIWKLKVNDNEVETYNKVEVEKTNNISPNPVSDFINVQYFTGQQFEIYSMFGLKVLEGTCNWQIDVSNLSSGLYIFKTGHILSKFIKI